MQDTAAQVAAMTAELSRLAEDLLPQEEEEAQGKHARRHQQTGQGSKDLRQRLLDSWDGKVSSRCFSLVLCRISHATLVHNHTSKRIS